MIPNYSQLAIKTRSSGWGCPYADIGMVDVLHETILYYLNEISPRCPAELDDLPFLCVAMYQLCCCFDSSTYMC